MVHLCACRLEELNEKRQSMVSKLKGVEKELTGTHAYICHTPPQHPGNKRVYGTAIYAYLACGRMNPPKQHLVPIMLPLHQHW